MNESRRALKRQLITDLFAPEFLESCEVWKATAARAMNEGRIDFDLRALVLWSIRRVLRENRIPDDAKFLPFRQFFLTSLFYWGTVELETSAPALRLARWWTRTAGTDVAHDACVYLPQISWGTAVAHDRLAPAIELARWLAQNAPYECSREARPLLKTVELLFNSGDAALGNRLLEVGLKNGCLSHASSALPREVWDVIERAAPGVLGGEQLREALREALSRHAVDLHGMELPEREPEKYPRCAKALRRAKAAEKRETAKYRTKSEKGRSVKKPNDRRDQEVEKLRRGIEVVLAGDWTWDAIAGLRPADVFQGATRLEFRDNLKPGFQVQVEGEVLAASRNAMLPFLKGGKTADQVLALYSSHLFHEAIHGAQGAADLASVKAMRTEGQLAGEVLLLQADLQADHVSHEWVRRAFGIDAVDLRRETSASLTRAYLVDRWKPGASADRKRWRFLSRRLDYWARKHLPERLSLGESSFLMAFVDRMGGPCQVLAVGTILKYLGSVAFLDAEAGLLERAIAKNREIPFHLEELDRLLVGKLDRLLLHSP